MKNVVGTGKFFQFSLEGSLTLKEEKRRVPVANHNKALFIECNQLHCTPRNGCGLAIAIMDKDTEKWHLGICAYLCPRQSGEMKVLLWKGTMMGSLPAFWLKPANTISSELSSHFEECVFLLDDIDDLVFLNQVNGPRPCKKAFMNETVNPNDKCYQCSKNGPDVLIEGLHVTWTGREARKFEDLKPIDYVSLPALSKRFNMKRGQAKRKKVPDFLQPPNLSEDMKLPKLTLFCKSCVRNEVKGEKCDIFPLEVSRRWESKKVHPLETREVWQNS